MPAWLWDDPADPSLAGLSTVIGWGEVARRASDYSSVYLSLAAASAKSIRRSDRFVGMRSFGIWLPAHRRERGRDCERGK